MKKILIFALAFLVVIFIGRQVLVPKTVERGFARMVTANVGVDRTADLTDGLHVYICGAGSPLADPNGAGPASVFWPARPHSSLMPEPMARKILGPWDFL